MQTTVRPGGIAVLSCGIFFLWSTVNGAELVNRCENTVLTSALQGTAYTGSGQHASSCCLFSKARVTNNVGLRYYAWCIPSGEDPRSHHLQIELEEAAIVTAFKIEPRHTASRGYQYIKTLKLRYSMDGAVYETYKVPSSGEERLIGIQAEDLSATGWEGKLVQLEKPFLAKTVRFHPQSQGNWACGRFGIIGFKEVKALRVLTKPDLSVSEKCHLIDNNKATNVTITSESGFRPLSVQLPAENLTVARLRATITGKGFNCSQGGSIRGEKFQLNVYGIVKEGATPFEGYYKRCTADESQNTEDRCSYVCDCGTKGCPKINFDIEANCGPCAAETANMGNRTTQMVIYDATVDAV